MIIGLSGKKGSGKSTAAAYIAEKYGYTRLNFKDAMICEIKANFPQLLDEMFQVYYDGERIKNPEDLFVYKPKAMRALMQNYGTNVRRKDNQHYWVKQWMMDANGLIVVDDVRFLNEAQAVKSLGGIVVRIERGGLVSNDTHQSETEMDRIECDSLVSVPDGAYEELYNAMDRIVELHKV